MHFSLRIVFSLGLGLLPDAAYPAACDSILVHGLRNISVSRNAEASIATNYFNHCQKNFDSMSEQQMVHAEVEVFGYGAGGGGYSRSQRQERLQQWCTLNASTAAQNRNSYQESQTFYQGAVSAWEACNTLGSKDVAINPIISPDSRTVDIGVVYRGNTKSGVQFTGLKAEGFNCSVTTPGSGKKVSFPFEISNETIQINCNRSTASKEEIQGVPYEVLPRGTISVQTASDPFQLFFAAEYSPMAPLQAVERLQKELIAKETPVGTVIVSALSPEHFASPLNPQYAPDRWVLADGKPLPPNTLYERITGLKNAPDASILKEALYLRKVVTASRKQGENVQEFETGVPEWKWIASGREVSGQRANNDYEQDVDATEVWIDDKGIVTAQGHTLNWKHNVWGPWNPGSANVLGVGYDRNKIFYYYVKIN